MGYGAQQQASSGFPNAAPPVKPSSANSPSGKKRQGKKKATKPKKAHGPGVQFPPDPSSNGARYFLTKATLTGGAQIFAGAQALHAALLKDRSPQNALPEECVGFEHLGAPPRCFSNATRWPKT